LLAFDLLKRLQELRLQLPETARPNVFLTTNGTLADRTMVDWLAASGWHIKISLDGPPAIHDRWRQTSDGRGTYHVIRPGIVELARRIPHRLSVTAVLCRGADPHAVFWAIAGLGVQRIELVPVAHRNESVLPDAADIRRYERFVSSYAKWWVRQPDHSSVPSLVRFINRVRRVMGYDVEGVCCQAGRSFIAIAPEGVIYPCFRFLGLPQYRLGCLPGKIDQEAARAFQRGPGRPSGQRKACRRCWARPLCGGPCFACVELTTDDQEIVPLHCQYVLADASAAVWTVEKLRKANPQRLLGLLGGTALMAARGLL
jgi:uncharacterized protein